MNVASLADMFATARRDGWAVANAQLFSVVAQARSQGWTEVPTRHGDDAVVQLRPSLPEDASKRSLSAIYGLGELPLHTDGAHLAEPPDIVVLHAAEPNDVATLLWSPHNKLSNPRFPVLQHPAALRGGLFVVDGGDARFLSSAYEDGRYRYDPGCMAPCDERARQAADYFAGVRAEAYHHQWNEPNQVLVIDNRCTLHGRADATNNTDRVLTRVAYRTKAAQ